MMNTTMDLKNKVLKYIDSADDRLLRMIQAMAESYQQEEPDEPTVPEWFYEKLNQEREMHLRGETESYTWEEVKTRLRKKYDL